MDKDELTVIRNKPNKDLIESLEKMLEDANKGDLQGLLFVKHWTDGVTHGWQLPKQFTGYCGTAMIGEIHLAINNLSNIINDVHSDETESG